MVLHIDTDYIERYGLDIRELWVWTALKVLASNKPWQGTYQQLAKISNCGGKSSAQRAMQVLLEKGLVIETEDGFSVSSQIGTDSSQNGTDSSQNGTDSSQIGTESKEKEKYQKKIEKGGGKRVLSAHTREEVFLFDCYKIAITEYGYLHPKMLMDEMYNFYNSHAWPDGWHNDRKTDVWRYWLGREGKIKGGRQPELSEAVRPVMDTLIANIPPQVIVRLTEVVQAVTIDEQKIRFVVRSSDAESFAAWLQKIDIVRILAAYHKEISVARE